MAKESSKSATRLARGLPMDSSTLNTLSLLEYVAGILKPYFSNKRVSHARIFKTLKYVVLAVSTLMAIDKYAVDLGSMALKSCSQSAIISSHDTLDQALECWLSDELKWKTSPREWKARTAALYKRSHPRSKAKKLVRQVNDGDIELQEYSPYWFFHQGSIFRYEIDEDHYKRGATRQRILRCIGFSKKPLVSLLQQASKHYSENYANTTTAVWSVADRCWELLAMRASRRMDTVDLHENVKKSLLADITKYLSAEGESSYLDRGSPYRRGYLFHGPPGTGKSSLAMAIAACFNMDVAIIPLKSSGVNDSSLLKYMATVPAKSVLLLEDVDSAGIGREANVGEDEDASLESYVETASESHPTDKRSKTQGVSLSGLLNVLDGAAAPEGCVLIMTTNNPDALDPALIRPGRVDYKVAFHNADRELAYNIFCRVTSGLSAEDLEQYANEFAAMIPDDVFSPAELYGYLLTHSEDVESALDNLPAWMRQVQKERDRGKRENEQKEKGKLKKREKRKTAKQGDESKNAQNRECRDESSNTSESAEHSSSDGINTPSSSSSVSIIELPKADLNEAASSKACEACEADIPVMVESQR